MTRSRAPLVVSLAIGAALIGLLASTIYLLIARPEVTVTKTVTKEVPVEKPVEVTRYVDRATGDTVAEEEAKRLLAAAQSESSASRAEALQKIRNNATDTSKTPVTLRDFHQKGEYGPYGFKVFDVYGVVCIVYDRTSNYSSEDADSMMSCLEPAA